MNTATPEHADTTNEVGMDAPLRWLALGWRDFRRNPGPGVAHGLALAIFGAVLALAARNQFWWLAGAFSGFLIVAPILTTGLYQVSRTCATGHCVGMSEVFGLWRSADRRLVRFGLLLSLAGTGWVTTSAALITAISPVGIHSPSDFLVHVVLAPDQTLFQAWSLLGGVLAAPVFASSVVAIPMLVDTQATVRQAVRASWRAVGANPITLGIWALLIMALVSVGMLTAMLGLVVVIPWLAHASWHAYVELTQVADNR